MYKDHSSSHADMDGMNFIRPHRYDEDEEL